MRGTEAWMALADANTGAGVAALKAILRTVTRQRPESRELRAKTAIGSFRPGRPGSLSSSQESAIPMNFLHILSPICARQNKTNMAPPFAFGFETAFRNS